MSTWTARHNRQRQRQARSAGPYFFNHPNNGTNTKWWQVEIKFTRPITTAQIRKLESIFAEYIEIAHDTVFGVDGIHIPQWRKWPTHEDDGKFLLSVLQSYPVMCFRIFPYGTGCDGHGEDQFCELGRSCCELSVKLPWVNSWPGSRRANVWRYRV